MSEYEYTDENGNRYSVNDIPDERSEFYQRQYNEQSFFSKVVDFAKKVGAKGLYEALQLYYVTQRPDCPAKVKGIVYAALGYFILPLDVIPDIIPMVGFTDDIGVIGAALVMAHMYITPAIEEQARSKMVSLFGKDIVASL